MPSTSRRRRAGGHDFVVVANRLPVDLVSGPGEEPRWTRSPGGLVTALEPVMQQHGGAWIGWNGASGTAPDPFDADGMHLVPVPLSSEEVADYYEGFSNGTLWPLYHDVIATPEYHREWWDAYVAVNDRFAEAAAGEAAQGATVWVHDYQLQLVPAMLRRRRPDLRIGFFNHIPFPPYEIFAQLPWRKQVLEGLLGADLLGFQREQDAGNLLRAARRAVRLGSVRNQITIDGDDGAAPAPSPPARTRSRSTPPGWTSWPAARRSGSGPCRSATSSGRPRTCSSASTGSTTPRASCTGSRRSVSCSTTAGSTLRTPSW